MSTTTGQTATWLALGAAIAMLPVPAVAAPTWIGAGMVCGGSAVPWSVWGPASDPGSTSSPAPAPAPAPTPDPDVPSANDDDGPLPTAPPPSSPVEEPLSPPSPEEAETVTDEADDAETPTEVAPLPTEPPPPPHPLEPHAWGGATQTPLPPAPDKSDARLTDRPWRGRGWIGVALHASIPVGGQAPGGGTVVAPVPELVGGWRLRPFLALHTSISNYSHDAAIRMISDGAGGTIQEVVYGRITAFDLLTARFYVPRPRRVEPWAELGAGVGVRRPPTDDPLEAAGLFRVGSGLDLWLAPSLTLAPAVAYRITVIDKTVGHGLRAGLDLSIHW